MALNLVDIHAAEPARQGPPTSRVRHSSRWRCLSPSAMGRDDRRHRTAIPFRRSAESDRFSLQPVISVRALWESSGFRCRSVAIQVQSRRLSVRRPRLVKRPGRFSRGHAEASQRQNRGADTDVGPALRPTCPHAGHLKIGLATCFVERMRPGMSSSSARSPSRSLMGKSSRQRRRGCCTISGNQTRCASPAATSDHSRPVLFLSGSYPSSSRRVSAASRLSGRTGKSPRGRTRE